MLMQAKNRLLELKTKPAKLVVYIIAIGFLAWMVVQAMGVEVPLPEEAVDPAVFKGIIAGFFLFTFVMSLVPAFTKGASLFEMQDVGFLFVAPIRPRTILLYGLVKMAKTIVFGSWFMIFQIQWMRSSFGVGLGGVLLATVGYILMTLVCQTLTLCIYAFTNASLRRRRLAKIIIASVFIPVVAMLLFRLVSGAGLSEAAQWIIASPIFDFTPVVGWASAGITGVLLGELTTGILFLGLLALSGVVFFGAVYFGNPEYYEDVLGATESAFETMRAAQEDGAAAISNLSSSNRAVKIKGTGIGRGAGASTFFYKHVRESFRANRFGLWGTMSFVIVAGAIAWSVWTRRGFDADVTIVAIERHILLLLISFSALKMFASGFDRGTLETYNHYIFMVPDAPFSKWVWVSMEFMFKVAVEAIVIFGAAALIVGAPVWTALAAVVAAVLFAFFILGVSLTSFRITNANLNMGLLLVLYFVVVLVPLAPGVFAGVVVFMAVPGALAMTLALLTVSAWMLAVGAVCFALSKGMLHNCDMPVVREGQF